MDIEAKPKPDTVDTLEEMDKERNTSEIHNSSLFLTPLPPPFTLTQTTPESTRSISSEEDNMEGNEEERVSYFLQCFSDIPTKKDSCRGYGDNVLDHPEADSAASFEGDLGYDDDDDTNEENMKRDGNAIQDEFETVLVGSDKEAITFVVPSLLNDDAILQHLRTTLYGTEQRSFDTTNSSTDGTADGSTYGSEEDPDDQRTTEEVRNRRQQKEQQQCRHDPMVALFFKFFEFAQAERLKEPYTYPYFIMNLFSHLSNIRSDLEWAQDAAYRRQTGKPYVSWADYFAKDRSQPWFTYAMLVVITFTMLWAFYENDWKAEPMRINPSFGPGQDVLLKLGALKGQVLVEDGKWWLLVTPIFLHAGIIHFLLNSGMFFILCRTIERNHGWLHTALLFLLSGIVGNMVSAFLQPTLVVVGSSGGIFGLLGACLGDIVLNSRFFFLVLEERAQKETLQRQREKLRKKLEKNIKKERRNGTQRSLEEGGSTARATVANGKSARDLIARSCDPVAVQSRRRWVRLWCYVSLIIDIFINYVFGLLPFVDNFAHLGGLLFGFFVSLSSLRLLSASSFDYRKKEDKKTFGKWCHGLRIFVLRCGGGLSALCLVCVAVFFLRRSDGTHTPCPKCRYASCMALPKLWKPNDPSNWWTCDGCDSVKGYVYWQGIGMDEILVSADLHCPAGETVRVDIAEKRYKEMDQAIQALPNLCRAFCNES